MFHASQEEENTQKPQERAAHELAKEAIICPPQIQSVNPQTVKKNPMRSSWGPVDSLRICSSPALKHFRHTEPISWLSHPVSWKSRKKMCCIWCDSKAGMKSQRESALYHKLQIIRLKIIAFILIRPSFHPVRSSPKSAATENLMRFFPVLEAQWLYIG